MKEIKLRVDELRTICNRFEVGTHVTKLQYIERLSRVVKFEIKVLEKYHDCLLFIEAHPDNNTVYHSVRNEIKRIEVLLLQISKSKNLRNIEALNETGLEGSVITASFSLDLCRWLSKTIPDRIQFVSSDADQQTQLSVLKQVLPASLTAHFDKEFKNFKTWFSEIRRNLNEPELNWILNLFENGISDLKQRDQLFDSMQFFVRLQAVSPFLSRTTNRLVPDKVFYIEEPLIRQVDFVKVLNTKLKPPPVVPGHRKQHLVDSARFALLLLLRETDPVTYASVDETEYHNMSRGLSIALYYMTPSRRNALDAYVGFMAFRNGRPLAYGGAWIFLEHARIGINIFEPYRGGESAWIFAQIARLYAQRFGVLRFEVEPYQIGHNNSEGIKSGAFWFYYRLGFRPQQNEFLNIANAEWGKIIQNRSYRSPASVLKKLSHSYMIITRNKKTLIPELNQLTQASFSFFILNYYGNTVHYNRYLDNFCLKWIGNQDKPDRRELTVLRSLMALMLSFGEPVNWTKEQKLQLINACKAKATGREADYLLLLNSHAAFYKHLAKGLQGRNN